MAWLVGLVKSDFQNGCMFTIKSSKKEHFYLVTPPTGAPYIVNNYDKQIYAEVQSIEDDLFLATKSFFGRKIKLIIRFSECYRIIN